MKYKLLYTVFHQNQQACDHVQVPGLLQTNPLTLAEGDAVWGKLRGIFNTPLTAPGRVGGKGSNKWSILMGNSPSCSSYSSVTVDWIVRRDITCKT